MCPLYPIHFILGYAIILCPIWLLTCVIAFQIPKLGVQYDFKSYTIRMDEIKEVPFTLYKLYNDDTYIDNKQNTLNVYSLNPDIVKVEKNFLLSTNDINGNFSGSFNITGNWIGKTEVCMNITNSKNESIQLENCRLPVTILRKDRIIDHVFTISVITLVSVIYVHFGCALDWNYLKTTIKRPIGPCIGFFGQFLIMPVLSFLLGQLLFPDDVALQLGLFFTGVSPAGGASNIWTYILGGNLNLSITMTTISTFAAFGMMPLWIFTLGRVIFNSSDRLGVPYQHITTFAVGLVVPLALGFLIQRYKPQLCKVMVRILKPFASFLLLFIIIFAIVTNTYLFELFSWKLIVAGLALPWLGYILGTVCGYMFRQKSEDILAIAIETGIQNTGIAIFLLRISLPQPEADLTTVVPVAVAIMTPFPLMVLFIVKKLRGRYEKKNQFDVSEDLKNTEPTNLPSNGTSLISTINYPNEDSMVAS